MWLFAAALGKSGGHIQVDRLFLGQVQEAAPVQEHVLNPPRGGDKPEPTVLVEGDDRAGLGGGAMMMMACVCVQRAGSESVPTANGAARAAGTESNSSNGSCRA